MRNIISLFFCFLIVSSGHSQTVEGEIIPVLNRVKDIEGNLGRCSKLVFSEINLIRDSGDHVYAWEGNELYRIIKKWI